MMPIKPENKGRYPKDWKAIRERIMRRAGNRCECSGECGLHHGRRCQEIHREKAQWANGAVVLTVAHLDHMPENCADDNLKAMCQRCHLRYDRPHHAENASRTRDGKRGQMRLGLFGMPFNSEAVGSTGTVKYNYTSARLDYETHRNKLLGKRSAQMSVEGAPIMLTIGQLAERLKVSTHRLKYAVDQYNIAPMARVGILRVWSEDAIPLIESALARIAANRGGVR